MLCSYLDNRLSYRIVNERLIISSEVDAITLVSTKDERFLVVSRSIPAIIGWNAGAMVELYPVMVSSVLCGYERGPRQLSVAEYNRRLEKVLRDAVIDTFSPDIVATLADRMVLIDVVEGRKSYALHQRPRNAFAHRHLMNWKPVYQNTRMRGAIPIRVRAAGCRLPHYRDDKEMS